MAKQLYLGTGLHFPLNDKNKASSLRCTINIKYISDFEDLVQRMLNVNNFKVIIYWHILDILG